MDYSQHFELSKNLPSKLKQSTCNTQVTTASLVHLGQRVKEVHVGCKVLWESLAGMVMMD